MNNEHNPNWVKKQEEIRRVKRNDRAMGIAFVVVLIGGMICCIIAAILH